MPALAVRTRRSDSLLMVVGAMSLPRLRRGRRSPYPRSCVHACVYAASPNCSEGQRRSTAGGRGRKSACDGHFLNFCEGWRRPANCVVLAEGVAAASTLPALRRGHQGSAAPASSSWVPTLCDGKQHTV